MSRGKRPIRPGFVTSAVLLVGISWASPAYAYLDPGMGSFLVQMLIAVLFGVSLFFRRALARTLSFFRRGHGATTDDAKKYDSRDDSG